MDVDVKHECYEMETDAFSSTEGEGKHPVGRANVTKTEDPRRRIRGAKAKGRKEEEKRKKQVADRVQGSFISS